MAFNMDDYISVAERIALVMEKYPEATFQNLGTKVITIGQKYFVECTVALYRDPQDVRPAIATAWEPIPGITPYTRDSEMMNAETSAIGRAAIAVGIPSKKLASVEEMVNRVTDPQAQWESPSQEESPFDPWTPQIEKQFPSSTPEVKNCKHGARKYWQSPKSGKELWFCPINKDDPDHCEVYGE